MSEISYEMAASLLRCDPETGKLYWLTRDAVHFAHTTKPEALAKTFNACFAGKEAFTASDSLGYKSGRVFDKTYRAHTLVWLLLNKVWPAALDHINGDRSDNRPENLREGTQDLNNKNRAIDRRNTTGACGVYRCRDKWSAQITINRKTMHLGVFDTIEGAIAARASANEKFGFSPRHGSQAGNA